MSCIFLRRALLLSRRPTRRITSAICFQAATIRSRANINEAGIPSTGREDAIVGLAAAQRFLSHPETKPSPQIFSEFSLKGRVGVVTGGIGGLGTEMALVLAEQGATVYCLDLPSKPNAEFDAIKRYAEAFGSRIEYRSCDVTDQPGMRELCGEIADKEGSLDVCVAAAGLLASASCLDYPIEDFQRIMSIKCISLSPSPFAVTDRACSTNGVFITASAAAAQMARLKIPGSIILSGFAEMPQSLDADCV